MELLALLLLPFLPFAMFAWPELLGAHLTHQVEKARQSAKQQSEIDRKLAIAEAARAARDRGETYVPPSDYNR